MKLARTRKLGLLLVIASAGAQPAAGSTLVASALMLGLHEGRHAHQVSVVAEQGHLDLILYHEEAGDHEHGGASHPATPNGAPAHDDHVFHFEDADDATARRASLEIAPSLAMSFAAPCGPVSQRMQRCAPEPRARGMDQLRTVVLRL